MEGLGPFDLRGEQFLWLYGGLLFLAIIAGIAIPRWLRPEGRGLSVNDPEELAYLNGGLERLAETVVAKLLAAKAVEMGIARFRVVNAGAGQTSAERAVLNLGTALSWKEIHKGLADDAKRIDDRLTSFGMLMERAARLQMRFWQTSPYIALIVFGAIKWEVGVMRDRPVGNLTVFMVVTAVVALMRFIQLDNRTRAGLAEVASSKAVSGRLRRAPLSSETGMAVALYGTAVLAGSEFSAFHKLRDNSSSSGCSSDSGGDGGGGGGCGGCGD